MRLGQHRDQLAKSASDADHVLWLEPAGLEWKLSDAMAAYPGQEVAGSVADLVDRAFALATPGDRIVIMSNGGFEGIHGRLVERLKAEPSQ
jgi:UDP-N-acetylmuramate: L-alanyl-gamma-D-glutamyl-meso-diaminopimelate ligase